MHAPKMIMSHHRIDKNDFTGTRWSTVISKRNITGDTAMPETTMVAANAAPNQPSARWKLSDFIFGTDLLAAEYRAIRSFQEIAASAKNRKLAQDMQPTADAIQTLLEGVTWSEAQNHYLGTIRRDLTGSGSGDALVQY